MPKKRERLWSYVHKHSAARAPVPAQMSSQGRQSVCAAFPSECLTIGAGVAIFHLASSRVVVCYHTRDEYWFLPKGRKNANEDVRDAACREGFEESGYRNRILPLSFTHRQTQPDNRIEKYVTEALWIELLPLSQTIQYLLFWFIAETLPPSLESGHDPQQHHVNPSPFPENLTLSQRIAMDATSSSAHGSYEPVRHEGTGVNEEEQCYQSFLLPIDDAVKKLRGTVMADVVRKGWQCIQRRMDEEAVMS